VPERPRVTFDTDLRRRRLLVLLRLPAAVPALVILMLWSVPAAVAVVLAWLAALLRGRVPRTLHQFLGAYLRYAAATSAWLNLVTRRYPRVRRASGVTVAVLLLPQPRLSTLARLVLALPGIVLGSALMIVLGLAAVAAWFVALVRGRTTEGLRELGAFCVRYHTETVAFLFLLTSRAPRLEPPAL
jgi:hypothetical protein